MTIVNMQIIVEHEGLPYIVEKLAPEIEQHLLMTIISITKGNVPTIKNNELTAVEIEHD